MDRARRLTDDRGLLTFRGWLTVIGIVMAIMVPVELLALAIIG